VRSTIRQPDFWLFAILLCFWCYECLSWMQTDLRFTADAERDLLLVRALVEYGVWPLHGIPQAPIGLDIGPLYYLLVAPFVALWPDPFTVHAVNVGLHAAGLTAFWLMLRTHVGAAAALLAVLLYSQSAAVVAFTDTAWHAAAAPGVALALLAAGGWWAQSGRRAALVSAAALFALGLQIHASLLSFGPAGLLLLWARRRDLDRRSVGIALGTAALVLSPFLLHLTGILGDGAQSGMRHEGHFELDLTAMAAGLVQFLRARWLLAPVFTPWLVLGAAAVAVIGTVRAALRGDKPWLAIALIVQCAVGAVATARALGFEHSGRYFVPLIPAVVGLSALGFQALDDLLRQAGRHDRGRALTWLAVAGALVALRGTPNTGTPPNGYLTLQEQQTVARHLAEHEGLAGTLLLRRTHGLLQGTLSGARYLAAINLERRSGAPEPGHWMVLPDAPGGAPVDEDRLLETVKLEGSARTLALYRFRPAVETGRVRAVLPNGAERPCPSAFPFSWTELRPEVLEVNGFGRSALPDPTACGSGHRLALRVPLTEGFARLTLQLTDSGHFSGSDEEPVAIHLRFGDLPPIRIAPEAVLSEGKRWYLIDVPGTDASRAVDVTITPRGRLGFLDLY
jgi:hypothetical protein